MASTPTSLDSTRLIRQDGTSFYTPFFGAVAQASFGAFGNAWFVNPATGSDSNAGTSPAYPFATLYRAHAAAVSGNNDVVYLIGNGASSGSARLSLVNAQSVDSTATTGTLNWTKNATHLVGVTAPVLYANRARIAPPSGTYTQATFGSGNFVVVTGSGCIFSNFSLFNGFSTGGVNQICWTDNGSRNSYYNVAFGGMGDSTSAGDAGSRSLKIGSGGSGELYFANCSIGLDTVARSAANASLELAGGTPRNTFENCIFPMQTSANSPLFILGTGAACIDRGNIFRRCQFINDIKSTSTTVTAAISLTNASPGGAIMLVSCSAIGATKWGDTNALANTYVDNAPPTAASSGLAVNPS